MIDPALTTTQAPPLAAKPRLRGWLHLGATPLSIVGGVLLMVFAHNATGRIGAAVWMAGAIVLFGNSAAYHLGHWSPTVAGILRRIDHANIFVFIAATYTPLALNVLAPPDSTILLIVVWAVAVVGLLIQVLWPTSPRWLNVGCYLALGWVAVGWLPALWAGGGPVVIALIGLGGLFYSVGAVIYGRKAPNPWPAWFGFHEIFHALTVVAAMCHFAAIAIAVLS